VRWLQTASAPSSRPRDPHTTTIKGTREVGEDLAGLKGTISMSITNITSQLISRNIIATTAGLDFEHLARSCLANGGHELTANEVKFLGGVLQQLKWCPLTPEQTNQLLDIVILVREGAQ
jgi:hypothetical protein